MSSQTIGTACASVLSLAGGLFCYIEQNATVLNIIISGIGVFGAFLFGAVSWHSMHVNRRKDKVSAKNLKSIEELKKDNLRLSESFEALKLSQSTDKK